MTEVILEKLQFADNSKELQAVAQVGIEFTGDPPRRVDMTGRNRWALLIHPGLRASFYLTLQDLVNPLQNLPFAVCIPEFKVYLDFLRREDERGQSRTRYHELGHLYVHQLNPSIHDFTKQMDLKMIKKGHRITLGDKANLEMLSNAERVKYQAFKEVDEGIALYVAVEAEGICLLRYTGTRNLLNHHDDSRGNAVVLDDRPMAIAHEHGYRNVVHTCRDLRRAGLTAKEAIDLIIMNPPTDADYFFWQHSDYAQDLLR